MTEDDLKLLDVVMHRRDLGIPSDPYSQDLVRMELADAVPGLVAEVRRLLLQVEEYQKAIRKMVEELGDISDTTSGGNAIAIADDVLRVRTQKPKGEKKESCINGCLCPSRFGSCTPERICTRCGCIKQNDFLEKRIDVPMPSCHPKNFVGLCPNCQKQIQSRCTCGPQGCPVHE